MLYFMSFDSIKKYRNSSFSQETHHADFYTYANVKVLAYKCKPSIVEIKKCRTVGILFSEHGKFFLADMDSTGIKSDFQLQVSVAYLKTPLQSTIIPYPVQVFGTLQWKKRPVIFVKVVQVLNISNALRIRDIMNTIANVHLVEDHGDLIQEEHSDETISHSL